MQAETRHGRVTSNHRRRTRAEQVQTRRFALGVCLLGAMVVVTAVVSYTSRAEAVTTKTSPTVSESSPSTTLDPAASLVSATYTAELRGAGTGSTSGESRAFLTLRYDAQAQTVTYKLQITTALPTPCVATICQGAAGQSGSSVFTLFPGPAIAGNFSGVLAEGQISAADLVGALKGARLADLVLLIKNGGAYATVGTARKPIDAIRGQIR
jgi:hypothetical protein